MKFLFILDPLSSLKSYKDTSIAIMREAAKRGHSLYVCQQHDVFLRNELVKINACHFSFAYGDKCYELTDRQELLPSEFNAILMRKDPPFG